MNEHLLVHNSWSVLDEEIITDVYDFLTFIGYNITTIDFGIFKRYEPNKKEMIDFTKIIIYSETPIKMEDALRMWDDDLLDASGSLTSLDPDGNLLWRES